MLSKPKKDGSRAVYIIISSGATKKRVNTRIKVEKNEVKESASGMKITNAETEQTIWKDVENDLKKSMQLTGMGKWEQNLEELKNLAAEERGRGLKTAKETGNTNALTEAMKANGSANRSAREGLKNSKTYGSMLKELEDKNSVYADVLYTELGAAAFSSKYGYRNADMATMEEYNDILTKMIYTGAMPRIAETNKDVLAEAFQKALEQAFGNGKVMLSTYY